MHAFLCVCVCVPSYVPFYFITFNNQRPLMLLPVSNRQTKIIRKNKQPLPQKQQQRQPQHYNVRLKCNTSIEIETASQQSISFRCTCQPCTIFHRHEIPKIYLSHTLFLLLLLLLLFMDISFIYLCFFFLAAHFLHHLVLAAINKYLISYSLTIIWRSRYRFTIANPINLLLLLYGNFEQCLTF